MHRGIYFPGSHIVLDILFVEDALGNVLAVDGFVGVVGFAVLVEFVLENMEKWADISVWVVFAFEADSGDEVTIMISIGGF